MTLSLSAPAREMGELCRGFRKKSRKKQVEVAAKLKVSVGQVCRMETGDRPFKSETDVVHYLVACGAELDDIKEITEQCVELMKLGDHWLRPTPKGMGDCLKELIFHEAKAAKSVSYEPNVVPGLFQTKAYARSLHAPRGSTEWTDTRVGERLSRQRILHRNTKSRFVAYIHERALRLEVGEPDIMFGQMDALLRLSAQSNISLRVVPAATRQYGLFGGAFRLLGFEKYPTLAYLDAPVAGMFVEREDYVEGYRALNRELNEISLGTEQSRMFIATLANEYSLAAANLAHSGG